MLEMIVPPKGASYDESITIGDVVSSYHKGWWKVVSIHERPPIAPTVNVVMIMDSRGRIPKKPRYEVVDISHCVRFNPEALDKFRVENTQFINDVCNTLKAIQEK